MRGEHDHDHAEGIETEIYAWVTSAPHTLPIPSQMPKRASTAIYRAEAAIQSHAASFVADLQNCSPKLAVARR